MRVQGTTWCSCAATSSPQTRAQSPLDLANGLASRRNVAGQRACVLCFGSRGSGVRISPSRQQNPWSEAQSSPPDSGVQDPRILPKRQILASNEQPVGRALAGLVKDRATAPCPRLHQCVRRRAGAEKQNDPRKGVVRTLMGCALSVAGPVVATGDDDVLLGALGADAVVAAGVGAEDRVRVVVATRVRPGVQTRAELVDEGERLVV